jgi:tripartite-type tricarboxylate transporter receptor subunit TctC
MVLHHREGTFMNFARHRFIRFAAAVIAVSLLTLSSNDAWSQATRTIRIVVPFSPGGAVDVVARLLADQIGRTQGLTMVVENHAGAGAAIGTEVVSRAAPGGNTLLILGDNFVLTSQLRKLSYDPLTSFEPICQLLSVPLVIAVNSASSYRSFSDLISAARAKPGELTMASIGPATSYHFAFETLRRAAKVDMTFVPYPGTAPAVTALLGNHVTSYIGSYAAVMEQLRTGTLRALATLSRVRIEPLPDVATIAESGYQDYEAISWMGVLAPAETPKETISQLASWFTAAMQVPEVRAKLVVQGLYPAVTCGPGFAALLHKEYDEFGRVIRESNIKPQ